MSDGPYTGVILLGCLAWHTGCWCFLMCLPRTVVKHWLREGNGMEWKRQKWTKKRKEEACMYHPNLTNGAICLSVLTPASAVVKFSQCRGTWLFAFILSHNIFFVLIHVQLQHKKEAQKSGLVGRNAEMWWNTISRRHSAIFQMAIDSVNQSRETFQPQWQTLSKASLFLETRFPCSL